MKKIFLGLTLITMLTQQTLNAYDCSDIFMYCCIVGIAGGGTRTVKWNAVDDFVAYDRDVNGTVTMIRGQSLSDLIKPCQTA